MALDLAFDAGTLSRLRMSLPPFPGQFGWLSSARRGHVYAVWWAFFSCGTAWWFEGEVDIAAGFPCLVSLVNEAAARPWLAPAGALAALAVGS
jgi:hypothetical protein